MLTVSVPIPASSPLAMAPPLVAIFPWKVEPLTVKLPPSVLEMAPPKPVAVSSPSLTVTPAMSTYESPLMATTGPSQLEVVQPVLLPPLPLRMGLAMPGAGSIVSGCAPEVPGVVTVQLPM